MQEELLYGILGFLVGYLIYKYYQFMKMQQKEADNMFSDILTKEEYKVKGQYDHLKGL